MCRVLRFQVFIFYDGRELNLLSFGEEAEEEEQQLAAVKEKKIRSSHDVLQDPRLLKAASDALEVVSLFKYE